MQDLEKKYQAITRKLIEEGISISTMESASSGLIASLITDTEGASAIFKGAFITYSNEAKIKQGVPEEVIEKYGVYSIETAVAMAETCCRAYNSDIGIGVTGTYGNVDPSNKDSVCGEVYFSIFYRGIQSFERKLEKQKCRNDYKRITAELVADELIRTLGIKLD